jgi:hypothetical protein
MPLVVFDDLSSGISESAEDENGHRLLVGPNAARMFARFADLIECPWNTLYRKPEERKICDLELPRRDLLWLQEHVGSVDILTIGELQKRREQNPRRVRGCH